MNWDRIEGNWKQLRRQGSAAVGQLTDDDSPRSKAAALSSRQDSERYGVAKDEAEKQVDSWVRNM